jgi:acyl-CoA dehydrogenase
MAISFDLTENSRISIAHYNRMAREEMRPISRKYDEEEHALPTEWIDHWWNVGRKGPPLDVAKPTDGFVTVCIQAEEICWGDCGLYLRMPTPALGGSAVGAAGTPEQRERFLSPFREEGHPIWGAMAITEPAAG